MVIEHDHVEAKLARDLERLAADGAAIDGHHERRALRHEALNRLDIGAIALGHTVGDVDDRLQSAGVQIFAEQSRAARAVDVVVAEDRHPLTGHDRAPEALGRRGHIAQAEGVRHEIAEAWSQMAINRFRRDAAPRKHPRDQFVMSANLRNGERAHFSRRVKPRPPWLAERRGLDVEEEIGGRHSFRLGIRQRGSLRITCRGANHDRTRPDPEGFRAGPEHVVPSRVSHRGWNAKRLDTRWRRMAASWRRAGFRRRGGGRDGGALPLRGGQGPKALAFRTALVNDLKAAIGEEWPAMARNRSPRGYKRAQQAIFDGAVAQSVRHERHGEHFRGLSANRQREVIISLDHPFTGPVPILSDALAAMLGNLANRQPKYLRLREPTARYAVGRSFLHTNNSRV